MFLIDTHCHLHDKDFFGKKQAEECLKRAEERGVKKIICVGTSHEDSLAARDFSAKHENVYWTYGIHPEGAGKLEEVRRPKNIDNPDAMIKLKEKIGSEIAGRVEGKKEANGGDKIDKIDSLMIESSLKLLQKERESKESRLVAIGEVGLDYHYEGYSRKKQIRLFEEMLQLATTLKLPVSFHVREAYQDFFPIIENFPGIRGVVHSFTDSKKVLKRILETTDFYIGVNGLATYSTLPLPPLDRILLETDAPFLAPVPYRGKTNEPAYIPDIMRWLAGKLEISEEEATRQTTLNAEGLFFK